MELSHYQAVQCQEVAFCSQEAQFGCYQPRALEPLSAAEHSRWGSSSLLPRSLSCTPTALM